MRGMVEWLRRNRGPVARLALRYLGTFLVAWGWIPERVGAEMAADADLLLVAGVVIVVIAEGAYALARRRGWAT